MLLQPHDNNGLSPITYSEYRNLPSGSTKIQFLEAIRRLHKLSRHSSYELQVAIDQVYVEDVIFGYLEVGSQLEFAYNMLKKNKTRLEMGELMLNMPMESSFFHHLIPKNQWTESLDITEKRRATFLLEESLKLRNMNLESEPPKIFKKFGSLLIALKEMANSLVMKANEYNNKGVLQNQDLFNTSCIDLLELKNALIAAVVDLIKKFHFNTSKPLKNLLGKYELTSTYLDIRRKNTSVFQAFCRELKLRENKRDNTYISNVGGLDSVVTWSCKKVTYHSWK